MAASASNSVSVPVAIPAPGCIPIVGGCGTVGVGARQGGGIGDLQQLQQQQHFQQQQQQQQQLHSTHHHSLIGDELRAVLGLSASAIRGVKVSKQQTPEELASSRRGSESLLDGHGSSGSHAMDLISGLGGSNNIRMGNNSSRLINGSGNGEMLIDDLEGKATISALSSSSSIVGSGTTAQSSVGRRMSRRAAGRGTGASRSSGRFQASNLLSIIESEQAIKGTQNSNLNSISSKGGGQDSTGINTKSEQGGISIGSEGMMDLSDHTVSSMIKSNGNAITSSTNITGSTYGRYGGSNRINGSQMIISPSELSRIENLHFSVETVPHLVKDYVPAFSGKFAFLPQPPLDGSSSTGDYSEYYYSNNSGSGSQNHHYKGGEGGGLQGNQQEGGSISQGLRSRRVKSSNADCNNENNNNNKGEDGSMQQEMHLSKLVPDILSSICGGEGLKMVAKEKLSFWMDLPCNMDRKKAKTGIGPSTRESLRKELKKQGELFRLVSTKDEFLCDSKMIRGADINKLYLDLIQKSQQNVQAIKTCTGTDDNSSSSTTCMINTTNNVPDIAASTVTTNDIATVIANSTNATTAITTNTTTATTGLNSSTTTASTTTVSSPLLPPIAFPTKVIDTNQQNNLTLPNISNLNGSYLTPSKEPNFLTKMEDDLKGKLIHHFSPSTITCPGISISSSTIETNSPNRRLTQSSIDNSDHSGNRTENSNNSNNDNNICGDNLTKTSPNLCKLDGGISNPPIAPHRAVP